MSTLSFKLLPVVLACNMLMTVNANATDISTITEIAESASEIEDLVTTTVDMGDTDDIIDSATSGDSDTIFSDASDYVSGITSGYSDLMESLTEDATDSLSATASSVGVSGSASSLLSGSGYSSGQDSPYNWILDVVQSTITDNIETDCVEYKYIGQCWWIKTSWPFGFGSKSAAQNYLADLQVEVTSRIPEEETNIFYEADNAPTGMFLGSIVQNIGAIFGRLMDSLLSVGPDIQWNENQSAKTDSNRMLFREAMVIGNPTSSLVVSVWSELPGYCSSSAASYAPYFISTLDIFSWRVLATTDAVILGIYAADYGSWNEVGSSMGSVFPRLGYVETPDELDATVSVAYRALSVVSDLRTSYSGTLGLHIGFPTEAYSNGSWTNKSDMKYRTIRDHESQLLRMVYPDEASTCTNYSGLSKADKNSLNKTFSSSNKYESSTFKVYRPNVCCKKKHAYVSTTVLFSPSFDRY